MNLKDGNKRGIARIFNVRGDKNVISKSIEKIQTHINKINKLINKLIIKIN